jgi:hypothetical protein
VNDAWFGCEVSRSTDFGKSWQTAQQNPAFQANFGLSARANLAH